VAEVSGFGASVAGGSCGRVGGVAGTAAGASLLGGRVTSGGFIWLGAVVLGAVLE
jgi:hypothetical protein